MSTTTNSPSTSTPSATPERIARTSSPDVIRIAGARQHNLCDVDIEIPRRTVTVFAGVSGSGKSSLVFDTIAAEAQRQVNETYSAFLRNRLPSYGRSDVDVIDNLSPVVIIDQRRLGGNARSTVATITDVAPLVRLLFSRAATPWVGESNHFSFNDPAGMCPTCEGLGRTTTIDVDALIDRSQSLDDGPFRHPAFKVGNWYWNYYADAPYFDRTKPLADYDETEWQALLHGVAGDDYEGVLDRFDRLFVRKERAGMSASAKEQIDRVTTSAVCPTCSGGRLKPEALAARIDGFNIADVNELEITDLVDVIRGVDEPSVAPVVTDLVHRLDALVGIGLGYLHLGRATTTLSGGESQRIKMVRHLGSSLVEMIYVFDEPSVGLHPRDVDRLNGLLRRLADKGNTVLVVEHDPDVIEIADHVVELGPGAGEDGGRIVFAGSVDDLRAADTLTGQQLRKPRSLKEPVRTPTGALAVNEVDAHNVHGLTTTIPTGVLTVITGVAGSGKSTFLHEGLCRQHPGVAVIDQSAVTTNRRSTPATYTRIMDQIRARFAAATGQPAARFSANSEGACPDCRGLGVIDTDLAFLDTVTTVCPTCHGRRYTDDVLACHLDGASIADVLDMTVHEAMTFFAAHPGPAREATSIEDRLCTLLDVGLGYLRLGQPLTALSGGECQRLKLAGELVHDHLIYALDEPTTGLHLADTATLLAVLDRLVDADRTVVVIEHDLDVMAHADWIIELGPDAGKDGGELVFAGPPAALLDHPTSATAEHLRRHLTRA